MQSDGIFVSQTLMARLRTLGLDLPGILRAADLPSTLLHQGRFLLTTRRYFALWDAIAAVSGDPAIGLRIGTEASPDQLNIASLSALHSANFGDALRKLARYKRLICPEDIRLEPSPGEVMVTYRWLLADGAAPDPLIDSMFASAVSLAQRGAGKAIKPRRVELTRRSANRSVLARHFGCQIRFDAPVDALVFDAASLDIPFLTHDEDVLAAVLPGLDASLEALSRKQSFTDEVDTVLARAIRGQRPSVQTLAHELGVSPRTLQRRLMLDGTSYQQQLDCVRQRIARQLLDSTDLTPGEIAYFLGFEEVNSFSRAFHRWERVTPNQWRNLEPEMRVARRQ